MHPPWVGSTAALKRPNKHNTLCVQCDIPNPVDTNACCLCFFCCAVPMPSGAERGGGCSSRFIRARIRRTIRCCRWWQCQQAG